MKKKIMIALLSMLLIPLCSCGSSDEIKSIKVIDNGHKYLLNESLTSTKLSVSYESGKTETVDLTKDMLTGFDTTSSGKKTVLVSYMGEVTKYDITVVDYYISSIKVDDYLDTYYRGDGYSDGDATLTLVYSNDTTGKVVVSEDMITTFDTTSLGMTNVGVSYNGLSTSYEIKVEMPKVKSLMVTDESQSIYFLGDDFSGLEAYVEYMNGTSETIGIGKDEIEGFDSSSIGAKKLSFDYLGSEYEFDIDVRKTIKDFTLDEIQLYEIGDTLAEQKITVTNDDDTTEEVVLPLKYVEGSFDNSKSGVNDLSISYGGITKGFKAIIPLVNVHDYESSNYHFYKMEVEDGDYCDFSKCNTNSEGNERFEYGINASGKSTSNMGYVNDNTFYVSFFSSYDGTYNLQARVQSASTQGSVSQNLSEVLTMKVNGVDTQVKGIAEPGGSGNWVMTNWNTTTVASDLTLIKGLNTIEFTTYGSTSAIRVPNFDYFAIVVSAN